MRAGRGASAREVEAVRGGAAILGVILLVGCATSSDVGSRYDHNVDFKSYRAFGWLPAAASAAGQEASQDARLQSVLGNELLSRGFRQSRNPDFVIAYRIDTANGNLQVDFIDVKSDDVIWRGWGTGIVPRDPAMPIDADAIAELLEGLPQAR
ncbi:MAG: DUF4136 domain-containing protein [Candidatus Latescibacterota bacterium]|nr:MAG: DUF4136 domain-containing protein [Candidatus Latescibacterota bacterium]